MMLGFPNSPDPRGMLERLRETINQLAQEQNKALEKAAYVGMIKTEQKQYDQRHGKLVALLKLLSSLDPPR